jgi:hypothetical protein
VERLESIKEKVDPGDVFHNPQSVRPKGVKAKGRLRIRGKGKM